MTTGTINLKPRYDLAPDWVELQFTMEHGVELLLTPGVRFNIGGYVFEAIEYFESGTGGMCKLIEKPAKKP